MLVNMAHDFGIALSYSNIKYLHEKWALDDLTVNRVCPVELAENLPGNYYLFICLSICSSSCSFLFYNIYCAATCIDIEFKLNALFFIQGQ